jgi:glycosyltransferase involved in cell wall biosynthesis
MRQQITNLKPLLTVAIPTVIGREARFAKLRSFVDRQIGDLPVELISLCDNKEISIGEKRNRLLHMAEGTYVVMIDDDDWVADTYIFDILQALQSEPDGVGFQIRCSGTKGVTADASRRYTDWADKVNGFDYVRMPYQKTPILTRIAREIGYKDMRFGEDYDYSCRLRDSGLLVTEAYIPKVLYYYRYAYEDSKTKYGIS